MTPNSQVSRLLRMAQLDQMARRVSKECLAARNLGHPQEKQILRCAQDDTQMWGTVGKLPHVSQQRANVGCQADVEPPSESKLKSHIC